MLKKIRNNLSIRVFLWVFSALTICSMLIYGIILTVLPRQYQFTSNKQLGSNIEVLVSDMQKMRYDDAVEKIYNFCIQNNVAAMLSDDKGTLSFGEIKAEEMKVATSSIATTVSFLDSEMEYAFVVSSISQTADKIFNLMLRFLPAVFIIIIFLSGFSAFICSKVIVSPITKISEISKRMALLDLTWRCDIESNDEIGVLASSLNAMANRLKNTLGELESANKQLAADIKKFQTLEEQRRNFFAAVSHELKTPLTILKGQIENMIMGYGDYKNHDKYLPEALKTVEDIECLVREIITISKMESMNLQDTLQDVSLLSSTNDTIQAILPLARNKDIKIHLNFEKDIVLLVNNNLWNKALSNIIGNAVRHSPNGEDVYIYLLIDEKKKVFVIENTGVFIQETDLKNMFNPFYRVDKSRNKATGGSGLGLYVIKTILDLHSMTYCIKNTRKGVAFILYLD